MCGAMGLKVQRRETLVSSIERWASRPSAPTQGRLCLAIEPHGLKCGGAVGVGGSRGGKAWWRSAADER